MSQRMYDQQRATIVRQIQRDYGNRYVQRLVEHIRRKRVEGVQTKLAVDPAGDKFEQEADRVAREVVGGLGSLESKDEQPQVGMEGGELITEVSSMIEVARGNGQALPDNVRTEMESGFRSDFSSVKVHAGPMDDELNKSISSRAFTTGHDILLQERVPQLATHLIPPNRQE